MPEPRSGESRSDFIERCIPIVLEDGTAEDQDQAVAVCISMWDQGKGAGMEHEYKTFDFKVTSFDYEGRTVEGYAAAFGNIDQGNDIIHEGAFTKTLAERGNKVRFLWQHNPGEPIGRPIEMHEDTNGLFIKAIVSDALLRDNAISGLSIGYDAIPGGTDYTKSQEGDPIRNLREVRLWEFSLVTFPMNELAGVTALKDNSDKSINLTDRVDSVRNAFNAQFNPNDSWRYWISTVYDNYVIVEENEGLGFFRAGYSIDAEGDITFAPESEWTAGEYVFIPTIKTAEAMRARKAALIETLRSALGEAEALLTIQSAPADNAGRDDNADDQGAGPVMPPTSGETEQMRLDLLAQLESLED